ncbi:dienelactone hydrolase family protein [Paraburkholderia sediminicola]|uniref:dienelactone hydrolase family protein n=1 Tax=Paraburkholderia sp. D1E TaxID=3461398 RepID=UPI001060A885
MIERQIYIKTAAGQMRTFVCHPERNGPHRVVIFFMDAPGIREELRDMARRLATSGYYVLLPNLYYRSNVEELEPFIGKTGPAADASRAKMAEYMNSLTIPMVMEDTATLIDFVNADHAASPGPIGCVGYCMSGQFSINAAVRYRDRVRVAASFYGVKLVTDSDDSPHLAMQSTRSRLYFGCAETDDWVPPEMLNRLKSDAAVAGTNTEVEVYYGVEHGFAFPQRSAYDKPAAERHWERLLGLFAQELKPD